MRNTITLGLLLLFCSGRAAAQLGDPIHGFVRDTAGRPIAGAEVRMLNGDFAVVTDSAGRYYISRLREGRYVLEISKPGYATLYSSDMYAEVYDVGFPDRDYLFTLQEERKVLPEAIVSAEKKEVRLQEVAQSVSVLNAKAIEEYRIWNVSGLTGIVPTLYAADPGDNRTVTSIRGITTTSYDPAVAVYIDGVSQFGLDTYLSDLLETERIEVLRGPQSTLYGRNAMGGVINILTKQPAFRKSLFAEASAGNYGLQRYRAGIKTPVGKRLLFGAAGMYSRMDGFYTNTFDGSRYDRQSALSGNYFLKFLPAASRWTLTLNAKHQHARNRGAFPLVYGTQAALAHPYELSQNAVSRMVDNTVNASAALKYTGRRFQVISQTAYQHNSRIYEAAIDGDFSPADGISIFNNYGEAWNRVRVITQEIRISSPVERASALDWVVGTYLFSQRSPVKHATVFGRDATLFGAPDSLFRIINTSTAVNRGTAFFGQAGYPLTKKLRVTAGLRYDRQTAELSLRSDYQSDAGRPSFAIQGDTSGTGSYSAISPRAGLLWSFHPGHSAYFNYSRGFRTGGLTQVSADPAQPALSPYNPEYSSNFEAGLKSTALDSRLQLNVAAFYTSVTDLQVPTLVLPAAITVTRNTGALSSKGIEAEATALLLRSLRLQYSFGYTDARYTALKVAGNGTENDYAGNRQIFTPDITSSLALQYTARLHAARRIDFVARGEWRYLGRQYFDAAKTISQPAYSLFHGRLALQSPAVQLALWVRNAADARFVDYAYDFGAVHLGDPRTYGATLSVRLD